MPVRLVSMPGSVQVTAQVFCVPARLDLSGFSVPSVSIAFSQKVIKISMFLCPRLSACARAFCL